MNGRCGANLYFSLMVLRLDDCVVLHWNRLDRCDARIDKHFDGYCSLQHIAAGSVELFYNNRRHVLTPGWVWPCFPGPQIRFHSAVGGATWIHRHVAMRGLLVDEWRMTSLFPHEPVAPDPATAAEVLRRFDEVQGLLRAEGVTNRRRAINALEGLLLLLAEGRQSQPETWLSEAKAMLTEARRFPVQVDAVAAALGMSMATFRRRFTGAVGVAPRDFAVMARIERGRNLLLESPATVERIAEQLGYQDPFLFSRQFRAHTGMAPRQYRAAMASG